METPARIASSLNPYLRMDDLDFLSDDHTFLGSQVIHVVALLKVFCEGRFVMAHLHGEAIRLTEALQSQLAEHFALEEVTAFPYLGETYPEVKPRLRALLAQHHDIFAAFEQLRSALNEEPSQLDRAQLLATAVAFETAFEQHATEEDQLLNELTLHRQQSH